MRVHAPSTSPDPVTSNRIQPLRQPSARDQSSLGRLVCRNVPTNEKSTPSPSSSPRGQLAGSLPCPKLPLAEANRKFTGGGRRAG